jgi:hypothetical protein
MPEPIQSSSVSQQMISLEPAADPPRTEGGIVTMALVKGSTPLSELAIECGSKAGQVAAASADLVRNPISASLALASAAWELVDCVATYRHEADVKATILECTKRGGVPVGVIDNSVNCQGPKP